MNFSLFNVGLEIFHFFHIINFKPGVETVTDQVLLRMGDMDEFHEFFHIIRVADRFIGELIPLVQRERVKHGCYAVAQQHPFCFAEA